MEKNLYEALLEFKICLDDDKRIKKLNKAEKNLNDSLEVAALIKNKDEAAKTFGNVLSHYEENSDEVKNAQRKLYEEKLALDSHPLVKQYRKCYSDVNDLYMHINDVLFGDFNIKPTRNSIDD